MCADHTWRGLAATYAVVAGVQLYIAATSGAVWAVVLSAALGLVAVACGIAAWRLNGTMREAGRAPALPNGHAQVSLDGDRDGLLQPRTFSTVSRP